MVSALTASLWICSLVRDATVTARKPVLPYSTPPSSPPPHLHATHTQQQQHQQLAPTLHPAPTVPSRPVPHTAAQHHSASSLDRSFPSLPTHTHTHDKLRPYIRPITTAVVLGVFCMPRRAGSDKVKAPGRACGAVRICTLVAVCAAWVWVGMRVVGTCARACLSRRCVYGVIRQGLGRLLPALPD